MSSFAGYAELKAAVGDWLARDDLDGQIEDFIYLAECDIQRQIKFRMLDKIELGSTIADQNYIELPADYAEGGFLNWKSDNSLPSIEVASYDVMARHQKFPSVVYRSGGDTTVGTLHGNRLYIGASPGKVDYEFFYKSGVQHLGKDNISNQLLRDYPDCLLFGALTLSAPYLGADERIQTWSAFYENSKEETRMAEWRARASHGVLRMRSEVWPVR